ncbi:MAG: ATP-binding protein [Candidatus Gracilibacteria bacterium]
MAIDVSKDSACEDPDDLKKMLANPEIRAFAERLVRASTFDEMHLSLQEKDASFLEELQRAKGYQSNPDLYLAALHRVSTATRLDRLIEYFSSPELENLFHELEERFGENSSEKTDFSQEASRRAFELVDTFGVLVKSLAFFGFDRASPALAEGKSPLRAPFDGINVQNPIWQTGLEVSENFGHAIEHLIQGMLFMNDVSLIFYYSGATHLRRKKQTYARLKTYFIDTLPAVSAVLRNFKRTLLKERGAEDVRTDDVVSPLHDLLKVRFGPDWHMPKFPVDLRKNPDVSLKNADSDALLVALWEIVKNAFRENKVSLEKLRECLDKGKPYLTVKTGEAVLRGREVIVFEITDNGTRINIPALIEKIEEMGSTLRGWQSRDVTFGQILDFLSLRRVSIPLKGADGKEGKMSTGVGLHSARRIIQEHNGELFPVNLENGVSFLVVMPKEGQNADFAVSDLKISGAECAEVSGIVQEMRSGMMAAGLVDGNAGIV